MKHDFKFINYIDAPMHIMLGPNQQNFNFDDIREILYLLYLKI